MSSGPPVLAVALHEGSPELSLVASAVFPTTTERVMVLPLTLSTAAPPQASLGTLVGGSCRDTLSETRPGAPFALSTKRKYVPAGNEAIESPAEPLTGASHAS